VADVDVGEVQLAVAVAVDAARLRPRLVLRERRQQGSTIRIVPTPSNSPSSTIALAVGSYTPGPGKLPASLELVISTRPLGIVAVLGSEPVGHS
jgi:hypothetical protein